MSSATQREERLRERIARERAALGLKPWQFAPSEVDDGANPWSAGTAGHGSWAAAQRQRAEIRAKNPNYFDGSNE
jgi:hypothetical protein